MIFLVVFTAVVMQFTESVGIITALLTIMGGTIIGFAAMNTLGNIIAGLIIMITKPFSVGDRIRYKGKIADVVDIELIYTVLIDLDGVEIHVPNQLLLSEEIINYKKDGNIVRIGVVVTPGFDVEQQLVEKVLISAADNIPEVLTHPTPYVWINKFQNYAVEYELFVFIKDIKRLPLIHSNLHKSVLKACKQNDIDISTPVLLRNLS
ncbi:MAG: mechanosensitive ion channel [Promethearchaeota archaeon]|nr:MAG: mechanosensitive ion channel [Candidatus Lokiarchaeota archaeon]